MKQMWVVAWVGLALVVTAACEKTKTLDEGSVASAPGEQGGAKAAQGKFSFDALEHQVVVGADGQVALEIKPGAGFKINPDYPWKASFEANEALGIDDELQVKRAGFEFSDKVARLPVGVKPSGAGEHALEGMVTLSICEEGGAQRCLWFNDELVSLKIKAVEGAGGAAAGEEE
jgi:hypothetical protein